jgi:hypothetical protein
MENFKMVKIKFPIIILILNLFSSFSFGQKVSNTETYQIGNTIEISYILETEAPCAISLFISKDGAISWEGPLIKVSGDVGAKVFSGRNVIVWDVLKEVNQLSGDKIQFQVRVGDGVNTSNLLEEEKVVNLFLGGKVGDSFQGGIIAYISRPGDLDYDPSVPHVLIASSTDQSLSASWTTANKICDDLELNEYTDWYLPSKDELHKLYLNRNVIGGFSNSWYWSSTAGRPGTAWLEIFNNGNKHIYFKDDKYNVRAVRTFKSY